MIKLPIMIIGYTNTPIDVELDSCRTGDATDEEYYAFGQGRAGQGLHDVCVFETDSKLLVDACNGSPGQSYFHSIVREC